MTQSTEPRDWMQEFAESEAALVERQFTDVAIAESALKELADVYLANRSALSRVLNDIATQTHRAVPGFEPLNIDARYRALVEQIPAVVFMAYLDKGIGEAYVSPQIETALGFTQREWLEDPVRWYRQIHPDDKERWSEEAAEMFVSGRPLRSSYRVLARDGRILWFHCEARVIRREDGEPWFIHGVGFDITELKAVEEALHEERNVLSAILDTVGALIAVLDPMGRIVRFNRACEQTTGFSFEAVRGKLILDLFAAGGEDDDPGAVFAPSMAGEMPREFESTWATRNGATCSIAWSTKVLQGDAGAAKYIIATGIDITERKRLEKATLEISAREQRRIGQDLHDGLGQHLTGIAFMSKVLQEKLSDQELPEAAEAQKIVNLVNEAINKTRELSRGLLPVMADAHGLMSALKQMAVEVEDLFGVGIEFRCDPPVLIEDINSATHLYHIAQEALNNAIKHGRAKHIAILLSADEGDGVLAVKDDGCGIKDPAAGHSGMGLRIISYRANMIGGSSAVTRNALGGTTVTCRFPVRTGKEEDGGLHGR